MKGEKAFISVSAVLVATAAYGLWLSGAVDYGKKKISAVVDAAQEIGPASKCSQMGLKNCVFYPSAVLEANLDSRQTVYTDAQGKRVYGTCDERYPCKVVQVSTITTKLEI